MPYRLAIALYNCHKMYYTINIFNLQALNPEIMQFCLHSMHYYEKIEKPVAILPETTYNNYTDMNLLHNVH